MTRSLNVACLFLAACGVFEAEPSSTDPAPPAPKTPEENSTPPVKGEPVTGVFVSSSRGDDSGAGSAERPLRTLARAIALAKEQGQKVVACAEDYTEAVTILDGVSVYGYFDCSKSDWTLADRRATVRSPTIPAVKAVGITKKTRVEGFEFVAPDATAEEGTRSSVALFVKQSQSLAFVKVAFVAGKGVDGPDGIEGKPNKELSATASGAAGIEQWSTPNTCATVLACGLKYAPGPRGGTSQCQVGAAGGPGGAGGDGSLVAPPTALESPARNPHGRPLVATADTAVGGVEATGPLLLIAGSSGVAGADGTDGANGVWSFDAQGFVAGDGTVGTDGSAGQGAGGGGGANQYMCPTGPCSPQGPVGVYASATGGGGGAGGCAGLAGTPGKGGGASIAVLVIDESPVEIAQSRLVSGEGGSGGKGTLGSPGLAGGSGGSETLHSGRGGVGGAGGTSGLSGHGAPGPSIALAFKGRRPPVASDVELLPGNGGVGHVELRKPGQAGAKVLPAVAGESKKEHAF